MLIFSIAIRITISARRSAAPLRASLVEVSLNTDPMPCRQLTDTVTRPIVNLYRGGDDPRIPIVLDDSQFD